MKKNFTLILLLIGCLAFNKANAQDIHFSQFYETPVYRNPALAGIVNGDIRVQSVYRTQWNSFANAYSTGSFNAEYKMPMKDNDFMTIGVQLFYDRAGTTNLTTTHVLPALNYHKALSVDKNIYLSLGIMGGLVQRRVDRSKITTNSSYNGGGDGETNLKPGYSYFDGSAGLSLNAGIGDNPENNLVIAAALHHFNTPKNSFYNNEDIEIKKKIQYSADVKFGISESSFIVINTDYVQQGTYKEVLGGFLYNLKLGAYTDEPDYVIGAGSYYRWNDAVIPTVQLLFRPFTATMSYDVNISSLKNTSYGRGGLELSLTYVAFLDRYNSSANAVMCPRF